MYASTSYRAFLWINFFLGIKTYNSRLLAVFFFLLYTAVFYSCFFSYLVTSDASTVCRIFGQRVGGHFRFVYIDCTVFKCYLIFHVHCGPYYTFRRNSFTDFCSILLPALYGFFDDFIHGFTTCYLRIFFTFSTALFTDFFSRFNMGPVHHQFTKNPSPFPLNTS
jgi:hypothetical protein